MRRSAWIFLASILLPSLGLAWLAVRSVRDQQVVLEHQQVIISQNITDALAKNIQAQMDQVRGDFVQTTQQLLGASSSPQVLAQDFNAKLRDGVADGRDRIRRQPRRRNLFARSLMTAPARKRSATKTTAFSATARTWRSTPPSSPSTYPECHAFAQKPAGQYEANSRAA